MKLVLLLIDMRYQAFATPYGAAANDFAPPPIIVVRQRRCLIVGSRLDNFKKNYVYRA